MTTTQDQSAVAGSAQDPQSLQSKAVSKLAAARTWKSYIELDVKEMYFFASPHRQRQISSMTMPSLARMLDAPELNTDQAFILVGDFITEIVNAFMPEAEPWVERGPGMDLPAGIWEKVQAQIREDDERIFSAIKASNFYPELSKAADPDLAIGLMGMWIKRRKPHFPIVCTAIPFRELEIDLGPEGEIDYRAAVRFVRNHYVRTLLGEDIWAKLTADQRMLCTGKPADRSQVVWAYWHDYEDDSEYEVWQHVVMLGNEVVHDAVLKGEGSCPLVVTRFGATADWPHGVGPLYKGLPSLRQIDEYEYMRVKNAARNIDPPITYPDDSFVAVEQGIEEGMGYPIRVGTQDAIKPIYPQTNLKAEDFTFEEKLHALRKLFFVDFPEQRGDTPPTLGQWLDEMARAQRRVGTPGASFWREGPASFFLRFKHLLEVSGAIRPVTVDGRAVATMPRNPAQAAAEQQEVAMAIKAASFLAQIFPEEWKAYVDGRATMEAVLKKMRVNIIKMRNPEQVQAAIQQIAPLIMARHVGQVAPNAGTPGPAA
jgi:Bacteriophage head to tail connecting protein